MAVQPTAVVGQTQCRNTDMKQFAELNHVILQEILKKVTLLDGMKTQLDTVLARLIKVESDVVDLKTEVTDLTNAMSHFEQDQNDISDKVQKLNAD